MHAERDISHALLRIISCRSAGSNLYTGLKNGYDQLTVESSDKEKVTFLKFGRIECCSAQGGDASLPVLLLCYELGFQIWLLKDAVKEIVSRRDYKIKCARLSSTAGHVLAGHLVLSPSVLEDRCTLTACTSQDKIITCPINED